MRSVRARRAAMIGSAALLLLAPTVALAHAEPAPAAPSTAVELPPELVAAIQRDLGLTAEQYLTKADAGQQLVEFANSLREQYPDVFAGAWLDPSGNPLIGLADGAGKDAARKAAEELGYQVKDLPRSERTLGDQLNKARDWVSTLPAPLAGLIGATGVDVINNHLVMQVSDTATGLGLQLPDFLKAVNIITVPDLGSVGPQPIDAPGGVASQGGDSYAAEGPAGAFRCSLGFNGTNGAGQVVNISAGHCDPSRGTAGTPNASVAFDMRGPGVFGDRFGTFARSNVDGHDFSVIRIDDNAANRFRNNLVRVPGAGPVPIDGTADPVVGAPVCKSGLTTGFSCGTINGINLTVNVGARTLTHGFSSNICALQGDSGGTMITGRRALGISSASNVGDMQMCEIAQVVTLLAGDAPTLYATPINAILRDNPGLSVRTH